LIVLTGTVVCSMLNSSPHAVKSFFTNFGEIINYQTNSFDELIEEISMLARIRRIGGLADLEAKSKNIKNKFLKKGIELVVDGYSDSAVVTTLEHRYHNDTALRKEQNDFVNTMMKLSPVFGFAGTIIGLIQVLNNMTAPEMIGEGMATALLTTFYGLIFANLIFLPVSKKASQMLTSESVEKSLIIEGLLDISRNMNSKAISYRLLSSLGEYNCSKENIKYHHPNIMQNAGGLSSVPEGETHGLSRN
ncbi:MAG: motility protein A, partial [Thermodesulfobacteriota bacterium]